ncbi:hypothetical protein ILYODFUR_020209 [Ilyodon furcidens]|uniref:Uncharacterized protein n=1 Tax=Ilyodon furcidens TaxID=33524 RepID=A0ABV0UJU3_9TELE
MSPFLQRELTLWTLCNIKSAHSSSSSPSWPLRPHLHRAGANILPPAYTAQANKEDSHCVAQGYNLCAPGLFSVHRQAATYEGEVDWRNTPPPSSASSSSM